jgi:hypothetical protein
MNRRSAMAWLFRPSEIRRSTSISRGVSPLRSSRGGAGARRERRRARPGAGELEAGAERRQVVDGALRFGGGRVVTAQRASSRASSTARRPVSKGARWR